MNKLYIDQQWISVKDKMPEFNVSVLVFIPEEDNHITTGMWDVSKKWVLLDEYRVPKSSITYWRAMVDMPEDKSYTKSPVHNPAEDTITYRTRALQQQVFRFEYALRNIDDYINSAIHPSSPVSRMIKSFIEAALPEPPEVAVLLPPVSEKVESQEDHIPDSGKMVESREEGMSYIDFCELIGADINHAHTRTIYKTLQLHGYIITRKP